MTRQTAQRAAAVVCGVVILGLIVGGRLDRAAEATLFEAPLAQDEALATSTLAGSVRGADGNALGGVQVSAKRMGTTIATTVFTDEQGRYFFPAMKAGSYRVWAQAVGFELERANVTLEGAGRTRHAFTFHTIDDVAPQLPESEWMAALPEGSREQRRVKEILRVNCGMCHSIASVLQHRFDKQGWLSMIDAMIKFNRPSRRPTVEYHREELAEYLASVRGPSSPLPKIKFRTSTQLQALADGAMPTTHLPRHRNPGQLKLCIPRRVNRASLAVSTICAVW